MVKGGRYRMTTVASRKRLEPADWIINIFLLILTAVVLYPFIYMVSISVSDPVAVEFGKVRFLPVGWSWEAYLFVFNDPRLMLAYVNTIIYAVLGTSLSLLLTSLTAYPLSVKWFCMKKFIIKFLTVTMFFGGGIIPYYITIRNLHMINTIWVMILPGAVSAWNVILYRTFFQSLPDSLGESAYIDGANDIKILFQIILPLSKPLLVTMALFSVVGIWNDYFTALIFLNDRSKYPLQMILRSILVQVELLNKDTAQLMMNFTVNSKTIKAATIMVAMLPIMLVYPFIQKYFMQGMMIGSLKG